MFDSSQVNGNLISSVKNLVYELDHKLPNNLRLWIFGNIRKVSNLDGDIALCPVSLHK